MFYFIWNVMDSFVRDTKVKGKSVTAIKQVWHIWNLTEKGQNVNAFWQAEVFNQYNTLNIKLQCLHL